MRNGRGRACKGGTARHALPPLHGARARVAGAGGAASTARTPASFLSAVVLPELSRPSIKMRSSESSFLRLRSSESRPCVAASAQASRAVSGNRAGRACGGGRGGGAHHSCRVPLRALCADSRVTRLRSYQLSY